MGKRVDIKTGFICNNNCRFCVQAHNKLKGNRSLDEIKEDLEGSKERCDGVVLTGGEVTIRPDFLEIIKHAKSLGYKDIQVQSNCRMFASEEFCKNAIEAGVTEFSPALHGWCAEQHDYLTQAEGSFKQTVKGIMNMKKFGAYVLTNTVVVRSNYMDLQKIAKLLVKLGVDQFQFAFVHAIGKAEENFDNVVPNMTLASVEIKKGLDIGIAAGKRVMAEAMPYCMMQGYEEYVSERIIPDTEIRGAPHQNTDDYKDQRTKRGKMKFETCKSCKYDSICEGPWKEYPQKRGEKEFIPVKD